MIRTLVNSVRIKSTVPMSGINRSFLTSTIITNDTAPVMEVAETYFVTIKTVDATATQNITQTGDKPKHVPLTVM